MGAPKPNSENLKKDSIKYKKIMKSIGFKPKSKLGQVFLIDADIITEQLGWAKITKSDTILEIGPGLGALTLKLAEVAKNVVAIEYDKKLYSYLQSIIPNNVELHRADVLDIDLPKFNKIVSNIPYQISSPLIFKLIDYQFELAILMFQSEFANRLSAYPNTKDYSRLTVMASYYFEIKYLRTVPASSYTPTPKVGSAIIELVPKKHKLLAKFEEFFFEFVKIIFGSRRKMIRNSLMTLIGKYKLSKTELKDIISGLPNTTCRPEQLNLKQLIELSDDLYLRLNKS
jgi:16S rRNA (adenine1518-N6/adenine1519-N6)-dimethyltransferase